MMGQSETHELPPISSSNSLTRARRVTLLLIPLVALLAVSVPTRAYDYFTGDVFIYLRRVDDLLAGLLPFRDFPSEYPPLSFIPMLLPRLVSGDPERYLWLFATESAILASLIAVLVLWLARRSWAVERPAMALTLYALGILVMASIAAWRFDLFVGLLGLLGIAAFARGNYGTAGVVLGLGVVSKIYPVALLAVLVLRLLAGRERRSATRMILGCLAAVLVVMLPVVIVAGSGALGPLAWQDARGLQIESVGGGLVLLAHVLFGLDARPENAFDSEQIVSPASNIVVSALLPVAVVLMAVILAACYLRFRQDLRLTGSVTPERIVAYLALVVLALIVTNKVLSPQYLVWLVPVMALLRRNQALLFIAACVATIAVFPLGYKMLLGLEPAMILVLNVRNALLIVLVGWLLVQHAPNLGSWRTARARTAPTAPT